MLTVTCSSCNTQSVVPDDRPNEIICSGCGKSLLLRYPEQKEARALSKVKTTASNVASATLAFAKRHRKALIRIGVGILAVAGGAWGYKQLSEQVSQPELPQSDSSPDLDASYDLQPVESDETDDSNERDISYSNDYSDFDILSYLSENCENCGASLAGGYYTAPWEDGDNEYGYWICPRCGHTNIDWDSVDDDD